MSGTLYFSEAYEVLDLVNAERAKNNLGALEMDEELLEVAMYRAAECSVKFSHTRPDGTPCFTASDKMSAENIAAGQTSAESVFQSWMGSSGHKDNILASASKSIGIGCFVDDSGQICWVQCFSPDAAKKVSNPGYNLEGSAIIYFVRDVDTDKVMRIAGNTALGTMEAVSGQFNAESVDAAIVATVDGFWDALTASSVAGLQQCPVLLSDPSELSDETISALKELGVKKVYISGGTAAVSPKVEEQIKSIVGSTERMAGADAIHTALDTYEKGKKINGGWGKTAIVATSQTYHDALSASPYAYASQSPIFLTNSSTKELDADVEKAIKDGGFARVLICGGTAAIPSSVEEQLSGLEIVRKGGATAYETSVEIAKWCLSEGMTAEHVGVATATGYWDALAGAALCGYNNSVIVLADKENKNAVDAFIKPQKGSVSSAFVYGGPMAVLPSTFNAVAEALA
ncbi:cell wall-binding repeat-containing protein [Adlercreutzia sp. ZJ242]|uniref:cell wall-binding repeat-containing protein n=1 Tax=Adlercreutzia sp. ZJ242 TaxID=2709409 RepID=UPI0013EBCAF2|nr:cell wall-binding repeat-containing protein [Adlercreutzia sp. ZJ242]